MATTDQKKVEAILRLWEGPRSRKEKFHPLWEDLARIFMPRRQGFTSTQNDGERRTDDLFDGTPMQAARSLINNVGFFLRPEGLVVRMRVENDRINNDDSAKFWLNDSQERLFAARLNPKARHRQATGEVDGDLVIFGNGVLFIGESRRMNSLLYQSVNPAQATPLFSDEGVAEGMFREMSRTVRQLAAMFQPENLSDGLRKLFESGKLDEKIKILHAVLPRENQGKSNPFLNVNLPFSDTWIEIDNKHIIQEGGFHEFPFAAPRWDTASGEDSGRSPAMLALPDGETLQAMEETLLVAGQRAADPPLMAPNDGSFNAIHTFPGGISYYDVETATAVGGNPFFPLQTGNNIPLTRDMQHDKREQVFSAFFRNILNLPTGGPQMTATEAVIRKQEFVRELGPVFGRLQTDYNAIDVERSFNIMLRAGAFLPIPEILQGENVIFEYESPIIQMRQQIQAAEATQWAAEVIELSQSDADVLDVVNFDALARFKADASGVPNQIVNNSEDVGKVRDAKAAEIQRQQQMEAVEMGVGVVEKAANAANKLGLQANVPQEQAA